MKRGAKLEYAECYRRAKPVADVAPLLEGLDDGRDKSGHHDQQRGLAQFIRYDWHIGSSVAHKDSFIRFHERIARSAGKLGFAEVIHHRSW